MLHARRPNQNRVPVLPLHQTVVRHPAQRNLRQRQPVLRRHCLNLVESAEVRLVPVPDPVLLSLARVRVEAGACLALVLEGAVAACEEAPADYTSIVQPSAPSCRCERGQEIRRTRVELVERDSELPQAWEQLRLNLALDRVVDALVNSRLHPAIGAADPNDLGDLPGHVVGDSKALELALLVELVDGAQGLFVGRGAVRAVEVPHVDGAASVG